MQMFRFFGLALACASLVLAQGKGKGKGDGGRPAQGAAAAVSVVFSDADRDVIRDWMRGVPSNGLPPGLAKRGSLPPGLQKQLMRNGRLPPGLEKQMSPFPADLERRLPRLPGNCGCERVFLDGRALVVSRATGAILDAFNLF